MQILLRSELKLIMAKTGKIFVEAEADIHQLKSIAEDIGEIIDMIPDYQQYEAEEIKNRIQQKFKKLLKLNTKH